MNPSGENAVDRAGIVVEPLAQAIDRPSAAASKTSRSGSAGEQRVHDRPVEAVAGEQQGRDAVLVPRRGERGSSARSAVTRSASPAATAADHVRGGGHVNLRSTTWRRHDRRRTHG